MTLVFTYGSLMQGHGNHGVLGDAEFVGPAAVMEQRWRMHDLGAFPGVVPGEGPVVGEVYRVDEDGLRNLDHLEGHPDFYRRERVWVALGEETPGEPMMREAWMYVLQRETTGPVVPGGDWDTYTEQLWQRYEDERDEEQELV